MARLLERDAELASLAGAVEDAVAGRGSLVLVAGEAGIGKTSLLRAVRAGLREGVAFASGACEQLSVPVPLAAVRELVEAAGGDDPLAGAAAATGDRLALARSVLNVVAARAPVLAVIEDAHWADPLTFDLLRMFARRIEEVGVVIVVTYRDDEVGANPALRLLLGDLASSPAVHRIVLRALSEAAVQELAAGTGLDRARLMGATGGNPFLVVEAIAAGGRLPASVRDAALARAGRLSLAARQVVDVAAVVGQRVESALLASLVGDCSDQVDEALARGVLVADGLTLGFRHELIRDALEQCISPPRRAELHARVFAALVESAQPAGAAHARLAHHAELGGLADAAARYAILAAAEAERVGALREAYLQADRALRLGHELDSADRFELLLQSARTANFGNEQLDDAAGAARRAVALADELAEPGRRGRALMVLAATLWSLERVVEARTAAEQAIGAFAPAGDLALLAWAHATLLRLDATSFDPESVIDKAPEALELAERANLAEARIDVTISLGLARGQRGDREALQTLTRALDAARTGGFRIRVVRAYVNLMTVAVVQRDHARVDQIAAEALPLLQSWAVSALPIMSLRAFRARSLLDRGRWDEALSIVGARQRWWQGEYAVACSIEGLINARRGDPGAADLLQRAWADFGGLVGAEAARHGMLRLALVESAWLRDDLGAALAELRAAGESDAVPRFARSGGELALWGSRLGVELVAPEGAPAAVLLELEGDWRRAIDAWRELEAPYEAALAALPGDDRAAREALATLQRLGATAAARAFARERAISGARPARGPRRSTLAHPVGLTRREQELLEALATGASNAQIAQTLHLSERTVAHHVSAILHKLGAHDRHAAIEQARRAGLLSGSARTPKRISGW